MKLCEPVEKLKTTPKDGKDLPGLISIKQKAGSRDVAKCSHIRFNAQCGTGQGKKISLPSK